MNEIEFAEKFVWLKYYSEYYILDILYEKYKGQVTFSIFLRAKLIFLRYQNCLLILFWD